ncbi:hypothetical protein ACFYY8_08435 [Streptosporangium sp. NPDC001559]|uniref:hypothetical protein n=1 Tax=Streptosporangium sp. NPDC001559 TaxID=3366187 RepID=UPI0036E91995
MNDREIFLTDEVEEFLDTLYKTDRQSHKLVDQAILILERNGPAEGRPLVDSITGSKISNMTVRLRSVAGSDSAGRGRQGC